MAEIFEDVKPGDLITAAQFNKMGDEIEELFDRVAAIERTATGTISGMVKDQETNAPIIGARIYAVFGNVTYSSTPTDNLGNYSITNLLPGIYRVWAEAENYARSKVESVSVTSAATSTANFVLTSAVSMVVVPDVQGMPLSQARTVISDAGLQIGIILDAFHNIFDPADEAAASLLVINQSLSPGDPVPAGTVINLFLAVHAAVAIPPIILDIKPNKANVGTEVEIIGFGFGSEEGKVTFSRVEATDITDWKGDSIKVKVPVSAVSGDVQVTNTDGVKSNTFNFTVEGTACTGCTIGCTSGCTTGCTIGCTSGCTTGCTTSRITACNRLIESFRPVGPLGDMTKSSVSGGPRTELAACPRTEIAYRIEEKYKPPYEDIIVRKGLEGSVVHPETALPTSGEIDEGRIMVELGKAIIPSGTEVTIKTADGKEVKGSSLSSAGLGVQPVETTVEVVGADGKKTTYGGTLVSAEGRFKKDEGITIDKGTEATILVAGKTYTGNVAKTVKIGTDKLDMGKRGPGITRLTG